MTAKKAKVNLEDTFVGILSCEFDLPQKADQNVKAMQNCPFILSAGSTDNVCHFVMHLPQEMNWWLKAIVDKPETVGAIKATATIIKNVTIPQKYQLKMPKTSLLKPPCGADCSNCHSREQYHCPGCPAII